MQAIHSRCSPINISLFGLLSIGQGIGLSRKKQTPDRSAQSWTGARLTLNKVLPLLEDITVWFSHTVLVGL